MYPNLYYLFKDLFGIELPFLRIANSFGFCVALSFLGAAWTLTMELKRRQKLGIFTPERQEITIGTPASTGELITNFILGFIVGFKLLGLFFTDHALENPQAFIFSSAGSLPAGILVGGFFTFLKWQEKNKQKLTKPEKKAIQVWPSDRVGDMTIIAAIAGFLGAKIFDDLEYWDRFIQDPIGNLFSASGFTFYGGLIVAAIALAVYFRKHKMRFIDVADAISPSMMLAYGLGRLGCQIAGDGDWGIINSAYLSDNTGKVHLCTPEQFQQAAVAFKDHTEQFGILGEMQHASFKGVSWLPDSFFAYAYPHNVNAQGIPLANCDWGNFCNYLPLPVFPTPLYEIIACLLLFAFLWSIRKKITTPGKLFGVYLLVNGIERFLVEQIRVNSKYDIFGFHPSQAELISGGLIIAGILLIFNAHRWFRKQPVTN